MNTIASSARTTASDAGFSSNPLTPAPRRPAMLSRLLSHDLPRNKLLALILVAIVLGLAFAPFLFPGVKALNVAAKVLIFVVLVAAFDLLLG